MGDKDKSEMASSLRDREAMGERELIPVVVIEVECHETTARGSTRLESVVPGVELCIAR